MSNFLSTYWLWILLIGGMLFMHLGHGGHGGGHGGGCGGGHARHDASEQSHNGQNPAQNHPADTAAPVDLSKSERKSGHHHTGPGV